MEGTVNTNGATAELPVGVLRPPRELTRGLGIHGWSKLDPVLLAALATEAPLLLVGPHGTAKTLLVERLATALQLELRHYNASLVNYDDLVGIPIPDDAGNLRFVGTEAAIWDAEFVFFDELTRCRPDLQNKPVFTALASCRPARRRQLAR